MKGLLPIALACFIAASGAYAQEAKPEPPSPRVSKEERDAARAKRKAAVKEQQKKGEIPRTGEGSPTLPAASGPRLSKEERAAARAERKAAVKEAQRKGEIPRTGEGPPTK